MRYPHAHQLDRLQSEGRVLSLLPQCSYSLSGVSVTLTARNQRLLSLLAVRPHRRLSREQAALTLWPDTTRDRALCSLRTTLREIRHVDPLLLVADPTSIALSEHVGIDLLRANEAATGIVNDRLPGPSEGYVDLLAQPLLRGWTDDWIVMEQILFDQMRVHALEILSTQFTAGGDYAQAIHSGLLAVECDDLRESAHRVLIDAYLAEGNVAAAVAQLATLEQLLDSELGLRPSPDLRGRVFDAMASVR